MSKEKNLVFLPLGGTGEIGMNLNLYGYGAPDKYDWLMVDAGVTFGDAREPGIDVMMPDTQFIEQNRKKLHGLVLTHGHEDHIGAVAHLWPRLRCPVYATPFTAELVRSKLKRAKLIEDVPLHIVPLDAQLELGPFHISLIGLTHSIAEPNALAIRTDIGNILHTGDWKIDHDPLIGKITDSAALKAFGKEGIDAIVCDSTNVLSAGFSGSESDVAEELDTTIGVCTGRVVVTSFASNVARLEAVGRAAKTAKRHVCLLGRGMHRIYQAARRTGYLKDFPKLIDEETIHTVPRDKLLVLCTGSQGEPRAALARLSLGKHPFLTLEAGDTVIFSSKMIPGNETDILELQNRLAGLDVEVLTSGARLLHVSGHPNREELKQMYQWARPRSAVPVHGEYRHLLAHAALAEELGVKQAVRARNGDVVRLVPSPAEIIDTVPYGRIHLDGDIFLPAEKSPAPIRRKLGYNGVVSVAVALDQRGRLAGAPEVSLLGLPDNDGRGVALEAWVRGAAERAVPEKEAIDVTQTGDAIKKYIRHEMRRRWGKKPEVMVHFVHV